MSNKSLPDIALTILKKKKKPIPFATLWDLVSVDLSFSVQDKKSRMVKFYNAMSLDSRFVQLEKNTWDLRERQTYETIRLKVEAVDLSEDEIEIEEVNDESFELYDSLNEEMY